MHESLKSPLSARLDAGDVIVIDGGTGTEVEALGGSTVAGLWSGAMNHEHPDLVLRAHENYLDAGAELLIANTYASSRHLLERAQLGSEFESINRVGVELALEARRNRNRLDAVVAGSISTTEMLGSTAPLDERRRDWFDQARILAEAGSELIVLEMMRDLAATTAALDAVESVGLPVWVGFSCHVDDDGTPILFNRDASLAEGMGILEHRDVEAVMVMHTEVDAVDACLDVVQAEWNGAVGVYAQHGDFIDYVWIPDPSFTPAAHTEHCIRWIDRGVQVIGGCCGIGPAHIADLHRVVSTRT